MGKSLKRNGIIVLIIIIAIILGISGIMFIASEKEEIVIPQPGYINFSNIDRDNNCSYNHIVRFEEDDINVTSRVVEWDTYEEIFSISKEYNRTQVDDVWYLLVKGCLKMKGSSPRLDCDCCPENPIEMVDENGTVVVHGLYNSHKFYGYVQGKYSKIFMDRGDVKRGYEKLEAFSKVLNDNLQFELSKYKDYIYLPQNEASLQCDDDQYFSVGGGGVGPHALMAADFSCDAAGGRLESIRLKIKYKTEEDYSNENTLKILYNDTIETGLKFNSSKEEKEVVIDVTDNFDLENLVVEDISLYYENHGGIIPTPIISFEFAVIEVTSYDP